MLQRSNAPSPNRPFAHAFRLESGIREKNLEDSTRIQHASVLTYRP